MDSVLSTAPTLTKYCAYYLTGTIRSFDSLWGKYTREKQDIKMLNEMNDTPWDWPEDINW